MSSIVIRPRTGEIVIRQAQTTLVLGKRSVPQSLQSAYVEVTSTQITGSTVLVDIPGLTLDFPLTESARILAMMTVQAKTAASLVTTGWAISINGVDGTEMQMSPGTFPDIATAQARSPVLAAGTYTVKGRYRLPSGIGTLVAEVMQLSAIQVRA